MTQKCVDAVYIYINPNKPTHIDDVQMKHFNSAEE